MEPYQAASPSNRNMIFTWIVRRALHVNAILIKSQSCYAVMLYIFFWWGRQRGWVEGSHCENVPVKNNAYLFSFYKGNFSFSYFSFICGRIDGTHFSCLHTVYLKQSASSLQKSNDCPHCRGVGHTMPSWLASIILPFFQTEITCHRKLYWLCHRLPIIKLS